MVKLMDEENLLNEIVVSASRTQKDLESPVTVERMGVAEIKKRRHQLLLRRFRELKRSSNEH
jgi:hypothetical protein